MPTDQTEQVGAKSERPTVAQRIAEEIERQDNRWPVFERDRRSIRLGLACLEDEVREAFQAFEDDRHDDFCGLGWSGTTDELIQVAALATRLARDLRERPSR